MVATSPSPIVNRRKTKIGRRTRKRTHGDADRRHHPCNFPSSGDSLIFPCLPRVGSSKKLDSNDEKKKKKEKKRERERTGCF